MDEKLSIGNWLLRTLNSHAVDYYPIQDLAGSLRLFSLIEGGETLVCIVDFDEHAGLYTIHACWFWSWACGFLVALYYLFHLMTFSPVIENKETWN